MEKQKSSVRYAPEVRERAVRMVLEHGGSHASQWEAIASIAAKIGCSGETLPKMGAAGGAGPRPAGWSDQRGAGADQGPGAGEP